MKLFGQAKADHPTPRAFHQHKASDDRSKGDPDNQASNGSKRDGHGDTPSNRTKRMDGGADGFSLPRHSMSLCPSSKECCPDRCPDFRRAIN
jgi:hypothetical protein